MWPLPVRVERLEHDQMRAGRDARARAAGVEPVARDDAGDVRAVAVVVVRRRAARRRNRRTDRRAMRAGGIGEVVVPARSRPSR